MHACMLRCSVVSNFFETWTVAHQAPLSMEFSSQEYWRRLPLERVAISYSRDLPDPGNKPASPVSLALAGGFFTTMPPGKPITHKYQCINFK